MENNKPSRRSDILLQEIGKEVFLYDPSKGVLHVLNPTAIFVWNQCDGEHTITEIEENLRENFQVADEIELHRDVMEIVQTFKDLGVLS
jgi:hypothetical protein